MKTTTDALQELSADFQMRLHALRKKQQGEPAEKKDQPKSTGKKVPVGMKMVFGKLQKVEELKRELQRLESLPTQFPEARERRVAAVREELARLEG